MTQQSLKTIDDILDANRKLLAVLSKRLSNTNPDEELYANEFTYMSSFVDPDQLITTELDSAYVACGIMFPNLQFMPAAYSTSVPDLVQIEHLSGARSLMQNRIALQASYFAGQATLDPFGSGVSVWDCSQQFFLKEPFLIAPGSTLRASFISNINFSDASKTLARVSAAYQTQWVLLGYKVKLV